jgi:ATP-dependent exoDNAse (exonuclease V) beta subunit
MLKHELIRASAGTGKTYQLTSRYLRLLRMGERPEEILAATFTRKAAGEIQNRILLRLAEGVTQPKKLAELRVALKDNTLTRAECLALLVDAAQNVHRLRVGTLDSFFIQLGQIFSLELGLPPGWNIAEEHVDRRLQDQAVEGLLAGERATDLLTLVHALTQGETTRSLDREVRDKVKSLYGVYRETDAKAWHRVPRGRPLGAGKLAAAIDLLRSVPLPENKHWTNSRAKDVGAAEQENWEAFISRGIAGKVAAGADLYYRKPIEPPVLAAYQPLVDHARAVLLNRLAVQTEATWRLLDKYHGYYERLKRQQRLLRFDDVTFQLATAENPMGAADAAFRLDAPMRHLLLDEFQDTSLLQWKVVQPYVHQITHGKKGQSFFCVGDAKQAIYGWRGGVAEVFDVAAREMAGGDELTLSDSWRSVPVILDVVNQIFTHLHEHPNLGDLTEAVTYWQTKFQPHRSAGPIEQCGGYACLQAARVARADERDDQKVITLRYAAEQVQRWQREAPGRQIGVLVRRNEAVRRLIYELRELEIEASEEGGSSLDDSAAVRIILSLVHLADHPADRIARFHLATSPLASWLNWFETHGTGAGERLAAEELAGPAGNAIVRRSGRAVRKKLMQGGYGPTLNEWAQQLALSCSPRELRRLEKLIGLAYQYDTHATSRPDDFLHYVETQKVHDPVAADVRVMTVHQAKGLEFDIVVLADLEVDLVGQRDNLVVGRPTPTEPIDHVCRRCNAQIRQLLPAPWQRRFQETDQQSVAESLCVLYVAVTRAAHVLQMIVEPSKDTEKSLHKKLSGLLRAALTDRQRLEPEQIAYEHGDRHWGKRPLPPFSQPGGSLPLPSYSKKEAEVVCPLKVRLAPATGSPGRGLERVSPSELEGTELEGTGGGKVVRWIGSRRSTDGGNASQARATALERGTLLHAWFEQIHWLEEGLPDEARLRQVAATVRGGRGGDEAWQPWVREFRQMCAHPRIAACLRRDAYEDAAALTSDTNLVVENERPFAIRDGDRLLTGNIDRLVTRYQAGQPIAAEILDYKTDAISTRAKLAEKIEFYKPQLESYRRAVCRMYRLPDRQVTAKLVFVATGDVETV